MLISAVRPKQVNSPSISDVRPKRVKSNSLIDLLHRKLDEEEKANRETKLVRDVVQLLLQNTQV